MIELEPKYCDVAILRWQDFTGQQAVLEGDGRSFEEIATALVLLGFLWFALARGRGLKLARKYYDDEGASAIDCWSNQHNPIIVNMLPEEMACTVLECGKYKDELRSAWSVSRTSDRS